jgi:hypothetical protein
MTTFMVCIDTSSFWFPGSTTTVSGSFVSPLGDRRYVVSSVRPYGLEIRTEFGTRRTADVVDKRQTVDAARVSTARARRAGRVRAKNTE